MNEIAALSAISAPSLTGTTPASATSVMVSQPAPDTAIAQSEDFASMFREAIASVDSKVNHADQMVGQFVLDDSTPIHQVTIALEEARMAVELAGQVRMRLTEGYRELMNMQL